MKRILALALAAVLALSCLPLIAFAAEDESYTKSYVVEVAPKFRNMIAIESLSGSCYVKEGEPFRFKVLVKGRYRSDQTTVIKYGNTHQQTDLIIGEKDEYGIRIYPDADGVYTIPEVNEDLYIYTGSLDRTSISNVKDFLYNFFSFLRDLMKWFFGLR